MPESTDESGRGGSGRVVVEDDERASISRLIGGEQAHPVHPRRMSAEDRFEQIVDVAVRLIGEKGYYGMSLQDVAKEIGISQTAVIHRVKSKRGLLIAVVERHYDRDDAIDSYLGQFEDNGPMAGRLPRIPQALRCVVEQNVRQPELVRVFEMLNSEAMAPDHPAHDYFASRPARMADLYNRHEWALPDGVDGEFVYMLANAAMYGLEGRWLANPETIDFLAEWDRYADYLFPLPIWAGYR